MADLEERLAALLDRGAPPATDATLGAIRRRASRSRTRRLRALTAAAVVVGLAGAGLGAVTAVTRPPAADAPALVLHGAASAPGHGATPGLERSQAPARPPAGLRWTSRLQVSTPVEGAGAAAGFCAAGGCPGVPTTAPLTRLFDRTTGDVTIRAFSERLPVLRPLPTSEAGGSTSSPAVAPAGCSATSELVVEVSNPGAVGVLDVPSLPRSADRPFTMIESAVVGTAESSPVEVLTTEVGPSVARVEATFADGATDATAVEGGWAILVDGGAAPLPADLSALDARGAVVGTASVRSDAAVAEPTACFGSLPPVASRGPSASKAG